MLAAMSPAPHVCLYVWHANSHLCVCMSGMPIRTCIRTQILSWCDARTDVCLPALLLLGLT